MEGGSALFQRQVDKLSIFLHCKASHDIGVFVAHDEDLDLFLGQVVELPQEPLDSNVTPIQDALVNNSACQMSEDDGSRITSKKGWMMACMRGDVVSHQHYHSRVPQVRP